MRAAHSRNQKRLSASKIFHSCGEMIFLPFQFLDAFSSVTLMALSPNTPRGLFPRPSQSNYQRFQNRFESFWFLNLYVRPAFMRMKIALPGCLGQLGDSCQLSSTIFSLFETSPDSSSNVLLPPSSIVRRMKEYHRYQGVELTLRRLMQWRINAAEIFLWSALMLRFAWCMAACNASIRDCMAPCACFQLHLKFFSLASRWRALHTQKSRKSSHALEMGKEGVNYKIFQKIWRVKIISNLIKIIERNIRFMISY